MQQCSTPAQENPGEPLALSHTATPASLDAPQASVDVPPQGSRTRVVSHLHAALKGAAERRAEAVAAANRRCSRRLAIVLPGRVDCGPHFQAHLGTNYAGRPAWRPCSLLLLSTSPQHVITRPPLSLLCLNVACKQASSTCERRDHRGAHRHGRRLASRPRWALLLQLVASRCICMLGRSSKPVQTKRELGSRRNARTESLGRVHARQHYRTAPQRWPSSCPPQPLACAQVCTALETSSTMLEQNLPRAAGTPLPVDPLPGADKPPFRTCARSNAAA